MNDLDLIREAQAQIDMIPLQDSPFEQSQQNTNRETQIQKIFSTISQDKDVAFLKRLASEFNGFGPLENLIEDTEITEIILNSYQNIWVEKSGQLFPVQDQFISERTYQNFLHRLSQACGSHLTLDRPMLQGHFEGFRVHIVGAEITRGSVGVNLRRHPKNPWTLTRFQQVDWGQPQEIEVIRNWVHSRKNFLVVGSTGCGKTSVLNACLQEIRIDERVLILEDTQELEIPNQVSQRLVARQDPHKILSDIGIQDLVKESLRMRPDRLVIGEIRGVEAKDLLMALSTGHSGSFGTLHASSPHQALIRLEMLIQLGAPHWGLQAIRRLIQLSLQGIIVVGRDSQGKRKLEGCYEITSLEESGFLIQKTN